MDIRKFFPSAGSSKTKSTNGSQGTKKRSVAVNSKANTRKRKVILSDSDSDEEPIPKPTKRKAIIDTDDVEIIDCSPDITSQSTSKEKFSLIKKMPEPIKKKETLKPAEVSSFFGKNPVKRSFSRSFERIEKPVKNSDTNTIDPEFDIHDDEEFERTLLSIDNTGKTVTEAEKPKLSQIKHELTMEQIDIEDSKSMDAFKPKKSPIVEKSHASKKRAAPAKIEISKKNTPKTNKIDASLNEIEDEKECNVKSPEEKRKEHYLDYQRFLNRDGPKALGSKEIPTGENGCLKGLTFVLTGILESMEREEAKELIEKYEGKVMSTISKNTKYIVAGRDAGPSKIEKAQKFGTIQIDEDGLLDLIRTRPGMNPKIITPPRKNNEKLKKEGKIPKIDPNELNIDLTCLKPDSEVDLTRLKPDSKVDLTCLKPDSKIDKKSDSPKPLKLIEIASTSTHVVKIHEQKTTLLSESTDQLMWVDKYKPTSLKQVIGQHGDKSNANKLLEWLRKWHKVRGTSKKKTSNWNDDNSFKAVLLSGPPGVGKTTTAQLACKETNFEYTEMNASDTRSKKNLQQEVAQVLQNTTLSGSMTVGPKLSSKHCIIMDEVDGMSGNQDRGGTQELIALIKSTKIPIICICNDRAHPKIRSLSNYCLDLRFQRPRVEQIKSAMMTIAHKEKIKVPNDVLSEIILGSNQDVRQVMHNMSLWSAKIKNANYENTEDKMEGKKMTSKDIKLGPFEVLRKVFASEEATSNINDKSSLFFHDYSLAPLFVQENYLQVQPSAARSNISKHLELISKTADSIRDGDLVDRIIRSSNNWSLLPTQAMYASVLPGEYMRGHLTQMINFPAWLGKNSKRNHSERIIQQLQMHMRLKISGNKSELNTEYIPLLRHKLSQPLVENEAEGVQEVISTMENYYLLREDLDSIGELANWPGKIDPMTKVNPKVKAALTRAFNKEGFMNPYSIVTIKKGRKGGISSNDDDGDALDEDAEIDQQEDEDDDNLDSDAMIKKKKTAAKKNETSQSTTKGKTTARGRARGKK